MRTSPRGVELIKKWEALRLEPYRDRGGRLTIGYGHLIRSTEDLNRKITEAEALELLQHDLEQAEYSVEALVKWPPRQSEFDALVSFCFNLGGGSLAKSTLLSLHNSGRRLDAAAQFQRWNLVNGSPDRGVLRRRMHEAGLYLEDP